MKSTATSVRYSCVTASETILMFPKKLNNGQRFTAYLCKLRLQNHTTVILGIFGMVIMKDTA